MWKLVGIHWNVVYSFLLKLFFEIIVMCSVSWYMSLFWGIVFLIYLMIAKSLLTAKTHINLFFLFLIGYWLWFSSYQIRCVIHQLPLSPPLSPAITLSLPLSILWKHSNHYYGSFAAWVAFRSEVETARTASGIRGFLFLFTQYTIFGIPHFYRRGGECIGVLRFATDLLSLETPPIEPSHVLAFALSIDTPTGVRTEHFVAMWGNDESNQ